MQRVHHQEHSGESSCFLIYQPPYNWPCLRDFIRPRLIAEMEWVGDDYYGRTFTLGEGRVQGAFTAVHEPGEQGFRVQVNLVRPGDNEWSPLTATLRRLLDLDANSAHIDDHLRHLLSPLGGPVPGLRLPGTLSLFEAGVRAILGQQVTVVAAHRLVKQLVDTYGTVESGADGVRRWFPEPSALAASDLGALRMPGRRKRTVVDLAQLFCDEPEVARDPENWLALKGIGPWSVQYARMRGLGDPDVWLGGDVGVQRALKKHAVAFDPAAASPWRSYLTLNLWSLT